MRFLGRIRIRTKLGLLLALAALALAAAVLLAGNVLHQRMMDDRVAKLRTVAELIHGLAQSIEDQVVAGKMRREAALARLRSNVRAMWYDDRQDYVLVYSMAGICLIHAAFPAQGGTDRSQVKDVNGELIVGSMMEVLKTADEGVTSYYFPKPGQQEALPKLTFVKKFKPWDIFIGTGVYTDDIDAEYRAMLLRLGGVGFAIMALLGAIAWFIGRDITAPLARLKQEMARLADGDLTIEGGEAARGDELGDMARTVVVFKENAATMRKLQDEQAALKDRADEEKRRTLGKLGARFEARVRGIVDALARAAAEMQQTARALAAWPTGRGGRPKRQRRAPRWRRATSRLSPPRPNSSRLRSPRSAARCRPRPAPPRRRLPKDRRPTPASRVSPRRR